MSEQPWRLFAATVAAVEDRTPHLRRVTFTSPELAGMADPGADTRIKLILAGDPREALELSDALRATDDWFTALRTWPGAVPSLRTYTLAGWQAGDDHADAADAHAADAQVAGAQVADAQVAVDFAMHDPAIAGPATRWAADAAAGDAILLVGPVRDFPGEVGGREFQASGVGRDELLFVADHCGLPALERILVELPAHARGLAVIEVPTAADELEMSHPAGIRVAWVHGPGGDPQRILPALAGWPGKTLDVAAPAGLPGGQPPTDEAGEAIDEADDEIFWDVAGAESRRVWVAAEASVAREVRRHVLGQCGLAKQDVAFMGYWRAGRAES